MDADPSTQPYLQNIDWVDTNNTDMNGADL